MWPQRSMAGARHRQGGGQNPFHFDHGAISEPLKKQLLQNVLTILCFFYIFELIAKDIRTFLIKCTNVLSEKLINIKKI